MENGKAAESRPRRIYKRNLAMAFLAITFFCGIILMYYRMVYTEKRSNIIMNGEVAARKSADQIDSYLRSNKDAVNLVAYALDEMITTHKSDEEINDFLTRQTLALKTAVDPDTTGFYGYINGRFFSGNGWQAPDDYDATKRPWYSRPFDGPGEVTILDPYLDMETNTRKLALGKVLCDGVSVVSMDLPTDEIQQMVAESVLSGAADMEIVICDDNLVIAHSELSEIGRDYDEEVDSLGAMIVNNLAGDADYYFEIEYKESKYIVYVAYIQSGFRCISIKNSSKVFGSLNLLLLVTIIAAILSAAAIIYLMSRYSRIMHLSEMFGRGKRNDDLSSKEDREEKTRQRDEVGNQETESLSKRILWIVFTILIVSESLICIASIIQSRSAIRSSVCQRMIDIANCAAGSVDGDVLKTLTADDVGSEAYQKVYDALAVYRDNVELEYVYGVQIEDDGRFTITVDPSYDAPDEFGDEIEYTDGLYRASQGMASVDDWRATDEWGTFYSSYCPVKDSEGNIVGIIGVDFSVDWFEGQLNRQTRTTVLIYIIILILSIILTLILCFFPIRSITDPLIHMTAVAVHYAQGDFSEKIETNSGDEIGVLSHALQTMALSLQEQIKQAEAANEAKSIFLANMSHEIRTPINTVLGMNEMIVREAKDKDIISYSENIKNAGRHLLGLINDILDFSKIEAGKTDIILVEYKLSALLDELVNMVKNRVEKKGLAVNISFDSQMPGILLGDENHVRQIITNLLTNAAKYTDEGSVTFKVGYAKCTGDPDSIFLKVSVSDTGCGIRSEDMDRLFNKFERFDEDKNRNIEGTGLGLSITQSLLELMGTTLRVESKYGKGSVFSFDLRQKVVSWEPMGNYEGASRAGSSGPRETFIAPDAKILAVDDNEMNLIVFKNLLKHTRMQVDTADGSDTGLAMMAETKYDLIFLDHMMPVRDGIETLKILREQADNPNKMTPTICLTANATYGAKDYYIMRGFDDYLTKPIDPEKLEDMILEYLPDDKATRKSASEFNKESVADPEREALVPLDGQSTIDVERGIKNNGSVSSYLSILKMFFEHIDETAGAIDGFYRDNDIKNYVIKVHALKSSARMIGAVDFGENAQMLEDAGKEENMEYIKAHHEAFLNECRVVGELISPVVDIIRKEQADVRDRSVADADIMNKVYNDLKTAADDMDTIRIDEILAGMEKYSVPDEEAEFFEKIKAAADNFDYNGIVELITDELQNSSGR